jgi:alpha-tubulin suppressor-like RCC1 family protein
VPVAVRSISTAVTMISGNHSFCALLSTSRVNCWGYGGSGQLGNGSLSGSDVPVRVAGITTAKALADSGSGSVCALLSSGKVDCWGFNGEGELGNGTTASSDIPVGVLGITNAKAVSEDVNGASFCVVLTTDHLKCWGYNGDGELGNGTTTNFTVPVSVKNISTATAVFGGENGFCALLSSKHLDCWGNGGFGELGNGSSSNSDVPVAVRSIGNDLTMVGGNDTFCALLSTSHVDCWGYGGNGQLGDGSFNSSDVPVPVS